MRAKFTKEFTDVDALDGLDTQEIKSLLNKRGNGVIKFKNHQATPIGKFEQMMTGWLGAGLVTFTCISMIIISLELINWPKVKNKSILQAIKSLYIK